MDWETANLAGQAELNLTLTVFLSSWVTLGKSLNFSELQGAPESNGDENFHLPEDLQKPHRKTFANAFPSLHLMGISGVGGSPPPRSGLWHLLCWPLAWHPAEGFSSPIFASHCRGPSHFIILYSPCELSPKIPLGS